jgi:hypothetical protein
MNAPAEVTLRSRIDALRAAGRPMDIAHAVATVVPLAVELGNQHEQGYNFFVYPAALFEGQDGHFHASQRSATPPTEARDLACMPPESRGQQPGSKRQSVYAVGAILYELITLESVAQGMKRPSELVRGVPPELEMILAKALVADPAHRPDDLRALAQALYQINTSVSVPPPPADVSHLDHDGDFDVDVSMSLMPPPPTGPRVVVQGMAIDAPLPPGVKLGGSPGALGRAPAALGSSGSAARPVEDLLATKARLEADRTPRYVVVKDGMDHGPFAALELLQQIASHTFEEADVLRDSLTGSQTAIRDHRDFAPFARHARLGRQEKQEKAALVASVAEESRSQKGKALLGVIAVGALLLAAGAWLLVKRGAKSDEIKVVEEAAVNVESDVGLKAGKKAGGARGGVVGKQGGIPQLGGGMTCEAAQSAYVEELRLDGRGQADLTAGQFQAVLGNGAYLNACGVPPSMDVSICAAIQNGRAVGVTVRTSPSDPGKSGCIAAQVRGLRFPSHPKLDVTRTSFAGQ